MLADVAGQFLRTYVLPEAPANRRRKVAEKHGLFSASDGVDLDSYPQTNGDDHQIGWERWSRAESIKR